MNREKEIKLCKNCFQTFQYEESDTYWDEKSLWGSLKLVKCPICGTMNIVKEEEDLGKYVNEDPRYF